MKNKGLSQYRFEQNPMERKFAVAWENVNDCNVSGRGYLDYMLAEHNNKPSGEVTDRDRVVAATVIQWLGSPVGMQFVKFVMEEA